MTRYGFGSGKAGVIGIGDQLVVFGIGQRATDRMQFDHEIAAFHDLAQNESSVFKPKVDGVVQREIEDISGRLEMWSELSIGRLLLLFEPQYDVDQLR